MSSRAPSSDLPLQIVMGEMSPFSIWKIRAVLTSVQGRDRDLGQFAALAQLGRPPFPGSPGRSGTEERSAPVGKPGSERLDVLGSCPVGGQSPVGVALQHREDLGEDVPVEPGICLFGEEAHSLA
jgi:hypothetical protein